MSLSIFFSGLAQDLPPVCPGVKNARYTSSGHPGSTFEWKITGSSDSELSYETESGSIISVNWTERTGTYQLNVRETTSAGCIGEWSAYSIEVVAFTQVFDIDQVSICLGESTEITTINEFKSYRWHDGSTQDRFITDTEGWVTLLVDEGTRCEFKDSVYVKVNNLPNPEIIDLDTDSSNMIIPCNVSHPKHASTRELYDLYEWSNGGINSQVAVSPVSDTSFIWVRVIDENGCQETDSIMVVPCGADKIFDNMPRAFNPNYDYWNISDEISQFPGARIEIFDRWGRLVFSTENGESEFWDGKYKGKNLPADTYYWIIHLNTEEQSEPRAGSVNLVY